MVEAGLNRSFSLQTSKTIRAGTLIMILKFLLKPFMRQKLCRTDCLQLQSNTGSFNVLNYTAGEDCGGSRKSACLPYKNLFANFCERYLGPFFYIHSSDQWLKCKQLISKRQLEERLLIKTSFISFPFLSSPLGMNFCYYYFLNFCTEFALWHMMKTFSQRIILASFCQRTTHKQSARIVGRLGHQTSFRLGPRVFEKR